MNWGKQRGLVWVLLLCLLIGCQNATEPVVPQASSATEVVVVQEVATTPSVTATKRLPSPTSTNSPTIPPPPTRTPKATQQPTKTSVTEDVSTQVVPTKEPTPSVIPTEVPTQVPPTEIPTQVPPTEVPTQVPPTQVVPTQVIPTQVPTSVPTEVPPTQVPTSAPTEVPATQVPTSAPTEVPATQVPTSVPTEVLATATLLPPTAIPAPPPPVISSSATGTQPVLLTIPRLGVNAGIESVGQTASGAMDVPENVHSVGWYNLGVRPGEMGNAVLSGHFDDYKQDPAVFWRLHELVVGDLVIVRDAQGREQRYEVIGQEIYPFDQAPLNRIFGLSTSHNLNLITCNGTWDESAWNYDKRLVVYTKQIKY